MTLENIVHKHYKPIEYKTAMRVFNELEPNKKSFLDYNIYKAEHSKYKYQKEEGFKQVEYYLSSHKYDLGDTIYSMYCNIYLSLKKIIDL